MMRRMLLCGAILCLSAGALSASTVLGLSIEDQARLSAHVVVGEVVGQLGVEHPDNGIETAVTLRVIESLKGPSAPGDVLVFHTRSGQVGDEITEAEGEARFSTGKPVLVFIESIDGRLYNLGLSMGVWQVLEGRTGRTMLTRSVQEGLEIVGDEEVELGPISLRDMATRIGFAVRNPRFDNPVLRDAFLGTR